VTQESVAYGKRKAVIAYQACKKLFSPNRATAEYEGQAEENDRTATERISIPSVRVTPLPSKGRWRKLVHPALAWAEVFTTADLEIRSGLSDGVQNTLNTEDAEDAEEKQE
jgi:hypothetical protein